MGEKAPSTLRRLHCGRPLLPGNRLISAIRRCELAFLSAREFAIPGP